MVMNYILRTKQLADKDLYTIRPVDNLQQFLEERHSLCLVHKPVFRAKNTVEMTRVDGFDCTGRKDQVWLGKRDLSDQGFLRCKLDRILSSPFLFASWKKSGHHEIKIIQNRKELARFNTFHEALHTYLPNGFLPTYSYTRERSLLYLFGLAHLRHREFEHLVTALALHHDNLLRHNNEISNNTCK